MTDPNWLYSSIVQSSAAVVAIVGGLLTATVINVMSKRNGLLEELDDLEAQSRGLQMKHDVAKLDLERLHARYYVFDHRQELLRDFVARTPEDALARLLSLRPEDISERALVLEGKPLIEALQIERKWLAEKLKETSSFPRSFWDWHKDNKVDVDDRHYSALEAVYDHLHTEIRSRKRDIDS